LEAGQRQQGPWSSLAYPAYPAHPTQPTPGQRYQHSATTCSLFPLSLLPILSPPPQTHPFQSPTQPTLGPRYQRSAVHRSVYCWLAPAYPAYPAYPTQPTLDQRYQRRAPASGAPCCGRRRRVVGCGGEKVRWTRALHPRFPLLSLPSLSSPCARHPRS